MHFYNPVNNKNSFLFSNIIQSITKNKINIDGAAPLSGLSYEEEIEIKKKALFQFFKINKIGGQWETIVPSPRPRHYRTTTKRRVYYSNNNKFFLSMSYKKETDFHQLSNEEKLEPVSHIKIYNLIYQKLNDPFFYDISKRCNYVIIRGNYNEFCLIFNMHKLNRKIVNKLKILAQFIKQNNPQIISCFVFLDPYKSKYYLDRRNAYPNNNFKKLFGMNFLHFSIEDVTYFYNPFSFSQINLSVVPLLLKKTQELLQINNSFLKNMRFIDLYCGYGLFSLFFAKYFYETWGIDEDFISLKIARQSVLHLKNIKSKTKIRFIAKEIKSTTLEQSLPTFGDRDEIILLDPPRNGVDKNVIFSIADRAPLKIIHVFCNIDIMPYQLEIWKEIGYKVYKVLPLDMFPGTTLIENIVLLTR